MYRYREQKHMDCSLVSYSQPIFVPATVILLVSNVSNISVWVKTEIMCPLYAIENYSRQII